MDIPAELAGAIPLIDRFQVGMYILLLLMWYSKLLTQTNMRTLSFGLLVPQNSY